MLQRLLLSLLLLLSGCAHFSDIEAFPTALRDRFSRHPVWLTITSFDNGPGVFPPAETSVIKKWETLRLDSGDLVLKETSSSSFLGLMDAIRRGRQVRQTVNLSEAVAPAAFFPYPGHALDKRIPFGSDLYEFKDIDGKRFQIRINGRGRIVFLPAPNNYFLAGNPYDVADVGIWTTPFGAEGEIVAHLRKLMFKDEEAELPEELKSGAFLHHDLSIKRQIPIVVDPSFPQALRPAVGHAAAKWNKALGQELFRVQAKPAVVQPGDCLSGRMVCLRWIGSSELALTGANGYTELAFDPQTGLIVGGLISVINDDVRPPFAALEKRDRQKFASLDPDFIADAMHRYYEMNGKRHPEPERYTEYLLLHEMGHFNGLGHNFYTTDKTTPSRPIASVMSYPPFPVAHRANYVGDADLKRLAIVYGQKPPAKDLSYCSTFEAMAPERTEKGYYQKPASCDMFIVGDGTEWYIRLAKRGRLGVFTPFPDLSNLSEELQQLYQELAARRRLPPLNVLTRLGFILGDSVATNASRRQRITAYLCGLAKDRQAIATQLKTFHGVTLNCVATQSE